MPDRSNESHPAGYSLDPSASHKLDFNPLRPLGMKPVTMLTNETHVPATVGIARQLEIGVEDQFFAGQHRSRERYSIRRLPEAAPVGVPVAEEADL